MCTELHARVFIWSPLSTSVRLIWWSLTGSWVGGWQGALPWLQATVAWHGPPSCLTFLSFHIFSRKTLTHTNEQHFQENSQCWNVSNSETEFDDGYLNLFAGSFILYGVCLDFCLGYMNDNSMFSEGLVYKNRAYFENSGPDWGKLSIARLEFRKLSILKYS